jgi:YfiH family protein
VSFRPDGEHLVIDLPGATALFTTRRGGVSEGPYASLNLGLLTDDEPDRVAANRERVRAQAGAERLAQGRQVHGTRVVVDGRGGEEADGQVTTRPGVAAIVLVADCLPVALAGADADAVGVVHAGWRGLSNGVLEAGVAALGGAGPVTAAIGPGIGPCCYEVGDDVRAVFGTSSATLDLKAVARARLHGVGVTDVHDCGLCTACDAERFFSHRRDRGVTGRQAGLAWHS